MSKGNIILIVKSTQPDSQEICTSFTHCKRYFFVSSDSGSASSKAYSIRRCFNSLLKGLLSFL